MSRDAYETETETEVRVRLKEIGERFVARLWLYHPERAVCQITETDAPRGAAFPREAFI